MNKRLEKRMMQTVINNAAIQSALQTNPVEGVRMLLEASERIPNTWPDRAVIIVLGIISVGTIIAVIAFAIFEIEFPTEILTMASTASGGLVGILTPSPSEQS